MNDQDLMTDEDRRWRELSDAEALGEFLTPDQRNFLEGHQPVDPVSRVEQQLLAGLSGPELSSQGLADRSPAQDEALVNAAVDQFLAGLSADDGGAERGAAADLDAALEVGAPSAEVLPFPTAARVDEPGSPNAAEARSPGLRRLAVPMAAAAAVVLSFVAGHYRGSTQAEPSGLGAAAGGRLQDDELAGVPGGAELRASTRAGVGQGTINARPRVLSGSARSAGQVLAASDSLFDVAGDIEVADSLCVASGHGQLCAGAGSRLRWHEQRKQLELMSGRAQYLPGIDGAVDPSLASAFGRPPRRGPGVAPPSEAPGDARARGQNAGSAKRTSPRAGQTQAQVGRVQLVVAGVRVQAGDSGSAYDIQAPMAEAQGGDEHRVDHWRLEVHSGVVHVEDDQGSVARLRAGDALGGRARGAQQTDKAKNAGHAGQRASGASGASSSNGQESGGRSKARRGGAQAIARELAKAREHRGAKRYRAAARTYERVLKQYADSPRARTAWVSLGQLQAGPLKQPKAALRAFESYLATGGGPLSEEARLGQISALRSLGLRKRERRAIEGFLATYPTSSYADALRTRLEKMARPTARKQRGQR